jgi:hypothetical protein
MNFQSQAESKCSVSKHKARFVSRGFLQRYDIDYNEVFARMARSETVILVVALASCKNWSMFHIDVKSAFLYGPLTETFFDTQPLGFELKGNDHMVYKLHKALSGLKQAPRAWNKRNG